MLVAELYRERLPGGAHGYVHVLRHVPKQPRGPLLLCGLPREGMRKIGSPFRGWHEVLCPECANRLAEEVT